MNDKTAPRTPLQVWRGLMLRVSVLFVRAKPPEGLSLPPGREAEAVTALRGGRWVDRR